MQNGRFPSKIALHLKKVCYKVSLCKYCQRQRCKAFAGTSIRAKMVRGERPLLRENLAETDQSSSKRRFAIYSLSGSKKVQLARIVSPLRAFQ